MARLWLPYPSRYRVAIAQEIEIEQEKEENNRLNFYLKNNTN